MYYQASTADRRKRLMRRIHTLQSEDQSPHDSTFDLDFSLSVEDEEQNEGTKINRNFLYVPDIHTLELDKGERPPHKRDVIEKIPMRARSQSWLIRTRRLLHEERKTSPFISHAMLIISLLLFALSLPWSLFFCLKIIKEYQRAVTFRLGRLIRGGTRGPGLFFVLPCIDTFKIVDLRVLSFDVPPQEILSRDSVTVSVEAVISVTNVNDAQFSTRLLAQTTLRNVLGTKTLSEMLSERDSIASITEKVLDEGTDPWGVKVERVEIKDIRLPHQLMRSMAAEAEAVRRARAAIIHAEGERSASRWMSEAAEIISRNKTSVQLRYLQTLQKISSQRNNTIVIPYPSEVAKSFVKKSHQQLMFES
ncbi:Stomatin-4 [Parelaphostrongylus tenuis]|uniref:Stomatin-4 n=1 Tax=Parelaphostrongylus tenuis TaxID=148309 RepID=A0AAD5N8S0_PARTN|nr:Stomatin-4 [Parelaphostrongylus tenuis]